MYGFGSICNKNSNSYNNVLAKLNVIINTEINFIKTNQSIIKSINQSVNHSINQLINQSTNVSKLILLFTFFFFVKIN